MLSALCKTAGLLVLSNIFMTVACYAHLKDLSHRPWILAAVVSWGIAYTALNLPQLKILQEVISFAVFVPFAVFYMGQPIKWDYLWAALCIPGAVFFIFRG